MATALPSTIIRPVYFAFVAIVAFFVFLYLWGTQTEINTTVRVSGTVHSEQPPLTLQHRFGGEIAALHVRELDVVTKGQVILAFDVTASKALLDETEKRRSALQEELGALETLLTGGLERLLDSPPDLPAVQQHLEDMFATEAALEILEHRITAAQTEIGAIEAELALLDQQTGLLDRQVEEEAELVTNGVITSRAHEDLIRQSLQIKERRAARVGNIEEARKTARTAELEIASTLLKHRTAMRKRQASIIAELGQLAEREIQLKEEIDAAIFYAPRDGLISELQFQSAGMVISPGQEIAKLSEPLLVPELRVDVPIANIDQVFLDMVGKLTFDSLPVRDMPQIDLRLTSIAPVAARDAEGAPVFYVASAEIDPEDLAAARAALGARFRLSADMPVTATFEGQSMSPFAFLFKPITGLFDSAFEDV